MAKQQKMLEERNDRWKQKYSKGMTIVEELDSYQREKMFDGVGFHTTR